MATITGTIWLNDKQLQTVMLIATLDYIKTIQCGIYSDGNIGICITDNQDKINTCSINKEGNYNDQYSHLL